MKDDAWIETGRLAELGLLSTEILHELRQRVFALKGLAELIKARSSDTIDPQLATLLSEVWRLDELLRQADGLGRPASSEHCGPMLLSPPVEASVALLQPRAKQRGVLLEVTNGRATGPVHADPVAVQQICVNLVSNALDAAKTSVMVSVDSTGFTVADDGPGIPSELVTQVFEPFFTTKAPGRGTGLGLAIARRLAEQAGGSLNLVEAQGPTRFDVRFLSKPRSG